MMVLIIKAKATSSEQTVVHVAALLLFCPTFIIPPYVVHHIVRKMADDIFHAQMHKARHI